MLQFKSQGYGGSNSACYDTQCYSEGKEARDEVFLLPQTKEGVVARDCAKEVLIIHEI